MDWNRRPVSVTGADRVDAVVEQIQRIDGVARITSHVYCDRIVGNFGVIPWSVRHVQRGTDDDSCINRLDSSVTVKITLIRIKQVQVALMRNMSEHHADLTLV